LIILSTNKRPHGLTLSPVIADLLLQDLEEKALKTINLNLSFYYRYVDDIVLAAPEDQATNILNIFNSFHDRLQFTIEWENNKRLSYLDLQLEVVNDSIVLDWFYKEVSGRFLFSGRFLSYFSNHPHCYKVGTMYNLVDRAILLSHPNFQQKNFKLCVKLLLKNGYLLNLIFKEIND